MLTKSSSTALDKSFTAKVTELKERDVASQATQSFTMYKSNLAPNRRGDHVQRGLIGNEGG